MKRFIAFLCGFAWATSAGAQARDMQTLWTVQPADSPAGERSVGSGEFVLKQRLLPSGLAELEVGLGSELAAGVQLVEVTTPGAKVYCHARVARQKLIGHAQLCLVDADMDGRFEGSFKTTSQTKGLLTIAGNRPKRPTAITPVAYRAVDPRQMKEEYFVAIERRNYFNIYSLESFMIAFGREGEMDRLTAPVQLKSADLPKELSVLGSRFTAIAERDGKMVVKVDAPMPPQPFGVVKTTTYRYY